MVNKEAAKVLVEYSQHIAHYAAIADVPSDKETVLTEAARNHAWRLLSKLIDFAEATKESDLYWLLLEIAVKHDKSEKERHRLLSIAKSEDRKFMEHKKGLKELLKEIQKTERADPTGKKRQAEQEKREKAAAEAAAKNAELKKAHAAARRAERKAEKEAVAAAVAAAATKNAKAASRKKAVAA